MVWIGTGKSSVVRLAVPAQIQTCPSPSNGIVGIAIGSGRNLGLLLLIRLATNANLGSAPERTGQGVVIRQVLVGSRTAGYNVLGPIIVACLCARRRYHTSKDVYCSTTTTAVRGTHNAIVTVLATTFVIPLYTIHEYSTGSCENYRKF